MIANLISSAFTVFLPAWRAKLTAFLAISSPFSSNASANAILASSLILCAPAFFKIRPTGAIGNSLIITPPIK